MRGAMIKDSIYAVRRTVIGFTLALLYEAASYALIAGIMEISNLEHRGNHLNNFVELIQLWGLAVVYRAFSLHLFASWKLKTLLIDRKAVSGWVAALDLAVAGTWAGLLFLVAFPPAQILFYVPAFWLPIFSAIFFGSLVFSFTSRKWVSAANGAR
jgi:hypothetical protein